MRDVAEFARKEPYLLSAFASTNALGAETRAQGRCKDPFQAGPYRRKPPGHARQPGSPPSSSQSELSALCRREAASAPRPPARPFTGHGGRRARDLFATYVWGTSAWLKCCAGATSPARPVPRRDGPSLEHNG